VSGVNGAYRKCQSRIPDGRPSYTPPKSGKVSQSPGFKTALVSRMVPKILSDVPPSLEVEVKLKSHVKVFHAVAQGLYI